MKKFFTLAMVACLGMAANAQDTSNWKEGDDVTDLLQWKAYDAADEDPANPVWQGFGYDVSGEWEFRPAGTEQGSLVLQGDGNVNTNFWCWGTYNLPALNVYQDFEIPAGVYTLQVAGCYRHGQDGVTLDLFAAGKKTENCFVYAKVGDDVYQEPIMYKFNASVTEPQTAYDSWMADGKYQYNGTVIYSPQCHGGADVYIERGYFDGNSVLFVVPEKMTIRVGINKPVAVSQDQIWWNHWKIFYESEYNDAAKAMVAAKKFEAMQQAASDFTDQVANKYVALSGLMNDEIMDIEIADRKSLESVNEAIAALQVADALNQSVFVKVQTMESVIDICEGILKLTADKGFTGTADLEAAVNTAKTLLYAEDFDESWTLQTFIDAGETLGKARIDYLLTQPKAEDGSQDFTHAVSYPWFVNQEFTPSYAWTNGDNGCDVYNFPDPVEADYFGDGSPGDEKVNLETGLYGDQENAPDTWTTYMEYPIANKAHWSTDLTVENQWIYEDTWKGWHGGYQGYIMKLKGYAAWYSAWASGANGEGSMEVRQVLTNLPDGFYTLEGRMFCANDGYDDNGGNEHIFIRNAAGETLATASIGGAENRVGFWGFWNRQTWIPVKTDFVNIVGGKATIGYSHNTMAGNAGVTLKYYGSSINYDGLVADKIAAATPAEGALWAGDLATYNAMIAKVVRPVEGDVAYNEAMAIINEAIAFKNKAAAAVNNFNLASEYETMASSFVNDEEEDIAIWEYQMSFADMVEPAKAAVENLSKGDNATYTSIEPAKAIFNSYQSYFANAAEARSQYYTDAMKAILDAQAADLKANYASVEVLEKYMGEIATEKNNSIFTELCKNASEANPVEITEKYIKNASFAEGPKTGWTIVTLDPSSDRDDPDMTINTYGRQNAESWNRKPFEISQTLYNMPAGTYELRVRACYRSESGVNEAMVNATADESFPYNAKLFANGYQVDVKSVCDNGEGGQGWEDPSFTSWYKGNEAGDALKAMGYVADWDGTIYISEGEYTKIAAEWEKDDNAADDLVSLTAGKQELTGDYPFDTQVGGKYYPSSMAGFQERCAKSPKAYVNTVQAYLDKIGTLKIGFSKPVANGGDWLIYDDFQLFYLGEAASTGITNVNSDAAPKAIYNMAGQRLNTVQKGINIVDGKKFIVK